MEIKFLDVSVKSLINHLNLTINSKQITGIFCEIILNTTYS